MLRLLNRRQFLPLLSALPLAGFSTLCGEEAPEPSAEDIQRLVKLSYIRQKMTLKGKLRNDESGAEAPFELSMLENTIRFRFDNPIQIIHVDLNDKGFVLLEVVKNKKAPVPKSKYG